MKIKKKINSGFFLIVISCVVFGCTNHKNENNLSSIDNIIHFDSGKSIKNFDLGNITDSTFQIIPLETTENSLISTINKIEIRNNYIYIMDNLAQSIYIYNMDGKYSGKINALGQAPGEYANLSYMAVTDSSVIVIDHFFGKQIEYQLPSLQFIAEKRIFDEIWCTDIFTLPEFIYYVNNWSDSKQGKFRLFAKKTNTTNFHNYLPFEEEPLSLGINGPVSAVNGNEASVIYSGSDVIYRITKDSVFPEYGVKFKNRKVDYSSGKAENVFRDNPESGLILGINAINESDKYLFFDVNVTGNDEYTCLYNKLDKTTTVYNRLAVNSLFDNEQVVVRKIVDNKIITWRDAPTLLVQKEFLYAEQKFTNKTYENRLKSVLVNLKEDDNPVLFIYNLK